MEWIKLNKKRDNLPTEDCRCWLWTTEGLVFGEYNSSVKKFYWHRQLEFSHYMIIPKPPAPT